MATDALAIVRNWLANLPEMMATFGERIYAAANLPPGYDPSEGPACLFAPRGGGLDYAAAVWQPSLKFRVYATTEMDAWEAWQVLFESVNDQQAHQIKFAMMESGTFPMPLTEQGLDWPFILSYFSIQIAAR